MRGYQISLIARNSQPPQGLAAQADAVHVMQAPRDISPKEVEPEEVVGKEAQPARRSKKKKGTEQEKEKAAPTQSLITRSLVKKAFSLLIAHLTRGRWL